VIEDKEDLEQIFNSNGFKNYITTKSPLDNMFLAAEMGWLNAIIFLLSPAIRLNSQNKLGESLLHVAARGN